MKQPLRQTILVVDDEVDMVQMLSKRLEQWGYRVLTATNGERGLLLAEKERPDLILLDVLLPMMKGREVCARLKANPSTREIPVIFVTALGMPEQVKAGMDLGAQDYIVKPWEPDELKERIWVCLMRRAARTD